MDIFTYDREVFKRKLKSHTIGTSDVNFAYVVVGAMNARKSSPMMKEVAVLMNIMLELETSLYIVSIIMIGRVDIVK